MNAPVLAMLDADAMRDDDRLVEDLRAGAVPDRDALAEALNLWHLQYNPWHQQVTS
jgi:hypothetical protein